MENLLAVAAATALCLISAASVWADDGYIKTDRLYGDDFIAVNGDWFAEGGPFTVADGALDINTGGGMTVWFTPELTGNVMIEYDITMVVEGGVNDNNRDMNCFWMARDPRHPDDLFAEDRSAGVFTLYDALDLYYAGYGGNDNTTSRFRKYRELDGERNKDILQEYTDADHLLAADTDTYRIRLVQYEGTVEYWRNGEMIWNYADADPYAGGHFGFRAYKTHYRAANFRVYRLGAPGTPVTGDTSGTDTTADTTATDTTVSDTLEPAPTGTTSTSDWQNFDTGRLDGRFSVSFDIVPRAPACNAVFCLAQGTVDAYADGAVLVRFFTDGTVDARDGGTYRADAALTYKADRRYIVRLEVDADAHRYDAYVMPAGGSEILLAAGYGFRTEQAAVSAIDTWALRDDAGEVVVSDVRTEQRVTGIRAYPDRVRAAAPRNTRYFRIDGRPVRGHMAAIGIGYAAESGAVYRYLGMIPLK